MRQLGGNNKQQNEGLGDAGPKGDGLGSPRAGGSPQGRRMEPSPARNREGDGGRVNGSPMPRKPVTVAAKKSGRNSQSPGKKPAGKRFQMYKTNDNGDDENAIKDKEDSPERTSGMLDQGEGLVEGLQADAFRKGLQMFEKDFGYEDKYNLSKDLNASPQNNLGKKQNVYVPGYAKARDTTTRVRKDFATTSGAVRNPSIGLRGKLGTGARKTGQSPLGGGLHISRQATASPGKSPGRKLTIQKKVNLKEETDLSTVEARPDGTKMLSGNPSKDRSTGEMMATRPGPLATEDQKEGFEEIIPDTPVRQHQGSQETGNTQRASRAGHVFVSGEGNELLKDQIESDMIRSPESYDQDVTPQPGISRLDDIVMHEQRVGDVIQTKFNNKMSLGSHILAQNILRGREQKALPVELQESSPENLMQKKLQMNQDIKDYQEIQVRQQMALRDNAQLQYQSQQLYVNNAAHTSKKRGFSAILGGSGYPAGQAPGTQTGRAGMTQRQMQGQMSYSYNKSYGGQYQQNEAQKLSNSQSLGLGPNKSMMRKQQSQMMKMSMKGRNYHGDSNKFQSIKSLQTAGTQRRAGGAQGGVSCGQFDTFGPGAQTTPNTWRQQPNIVGSSNYCKFGVKERFANNRIRGEIQDQFLGIRGANSSQVKQRNNLHLLQTFDPAKNNWSSKMIQDSGSQLSKTTPLSLLIKQDELKEKNKMKRRAFEESKRKKDEHYKQYIAQMNAHYRQQCAIQNEEAFQQIQRISVAEFGSGCVEPGSMTRQESQRLRGKGAQDSTDGPQPDQESMVLISDVVGSGVQTLTTPRLIGQSDVRLYRSSQMKKRNIPTHMQTLGTISSKAENSQGGHWRGSGTQRDVLSKIYHSKVDAREGQGLINQNKGSATQMTSGDQSELFRFEEPKQQNYDLKHQTYDTSQNNNSKSNMELKRGKGSSKLIDVERANRITRRQSDWIKKHTFKLSFQKSETRKGDGYMQPGRLGSADYEMIAVHENYDNLQDQKNLDKAKGGAQKATGKQAQDAQAQKANAAAGGGAEDDGDLSKIISDPVMHGFFDFKSNKWLRKVFDTTTQEMATPYPVPTLGSVVHMGSSVSPRSNVTGPAIGNQSPAKPSLLKGHIPQDQFATGEPRNGLESMGQQLMSSLPSPGARSSTSGLALKLEGVKTNEFLLTHLICPKLYKVETLQTARGPASPTSALSGNQILDSSVGVVPPQQAMTTPSVSVGGPTIDKRDTSINQPSILTGTHSTAVPKAQKQSKQQANNKRKNFTQYENMIWKFAEQITLSEWKKAQQISHQGQKIWGHRKQYFAFNFGMQCLIQGQFLQSSQVYEQVLVNEYQKKLYRSLKGPSLRKSLLENEIIASSLHNLMMAKLLHIQTLQESTEPENTGSNGEQTMSNRSEKSRKRSIRSKKNAKPSSMSANQPIQQSSTVDPMKKIEVAKEIVNSAQELLDLMEFHGLARITFTLNQEEINFQKLIAFTKQILKTNKAILRKDKLEKEAADEILQQDSKSQENSKMEQEDGSVGFSGQSQDNEEIIKVKMVKRILQNSRENESYQDPLDFKVRDQDEYVPKKKMPNSRRASDERVDSTEKSPKAFVTKETNNIKEVDETLELNPTVMNQSERTPEAVLASRHSSRLTKPSQGIPKQQAPGFLNKQVYLDQGTTVNYEYFRVTNFGALGASGKSKGRTTRNKSKDSKNLTQQPQLSFNPKVYQNKYVIDADKLQQIDKVRKFEDDRKQKEKVPEAPECCQPGRFLGKLDQIGEKSIDLNINGGNLGTIETEVEPLVTEIKVTSLLGLHTYYTKDLEQKYKRRKQRKDKKMQRQISTESQDSQDYEVEDGKSDTLAEDDQPPSDQVVDLEVHVLPFPNRNPLLNIKEAKKLGNEDVKPELGFGFIKKDELQRNAQNVQTVIIQEQTNSKSPSPGGRKGSTKSASRGRSPSKKRVKADKDGRSTSPMKGSAKDSDEPECTCENGEYFTSPFYSKEISDKIFLAINNKPPNVQEQKVTCLRCDQDSKDLLNLSRVDKCLITMEELEMDVNRILQDQRDDEYDDADQTGDFDATKLRSNELADPVHDQYIQLLQNIKNLCNDESIYSILLDAQKQERGKPQVTSTFQKERTTKAKQFAGQSAAKDILVRAVLKNHEKTQESVIGGDESPAEMDPVEMDKAIFRERIGGIIEAVDEELRNPVKKPRAVSYISLAGEQIKKLLAAARKKRKEREHKHHASKTDTGVQKTSISAGKTQKGGDTAKRSASQPSIDGSMDQNSSMAPMELSIDDGFASGGQLLSLQATFSEMSNLKILFERLGMHSEHFLKSLLDVQKLKKGGGIVAEEHPEEELNEEELREYNAREEKRLLKAQLVGFQTKNDSKIEEFVWRTRDFMAYMFHEWSALFLFQRTHCLSDFFEFCPTKAREYADEVQSTLTTIPLRFSILSSDKMDDAEHAKWEQREFTYNRNEAAYRLISQSLRYQSTMDTLNAYANSMFEEAEDQENGSNEGVQGLSKQEWIVEVTRKFNFITLLNFTFRECIDSHLTSNGHTAQVNDAEQKPDASGAQAENLKRQKRLKSIVKKNSKTFSLDPNSQANFIPNENLTLLVQMYALKKSLATNPKPHPEQFDASIIDLILSEGRFEIFQNLCESTRRKLFAVADHRSLKAKDYDLGHLNFPFEQAEILLPLNGEIEVYLLKQTSKRKTNPKSKTSKKEAQGGTFQWTLFQTVKAGVALPIQSLFRLSALYNMPIKMVFKSHTRGSLPGSSAGKVVDFDQLHVLSFDQHLVAKEIFEPLRRSLMCKIEAQTELNCMFDNNLEGQASQAETSPFLMFVLAIVCQVRVNKYSESVVQKGEIPKGLHLIIDGNAQITYEDTALREIEPSEFCRSLKRPKDSVPFTFGPESPDAEIKGKQSKPKREVSARSGRKSGGAKSPGKQDGPVVLTLGRPKQVNHFTSKKQVPKQWVKQQIEFKSIKKGSYFASRVLIDEAIIKNYIKAHKSTILRWIREPHRLKIESIIRQFTQQQALLSSSVGHGAARQPPGDAGASPTKYAGATSGINTDCALLEGDVIRRSMVNLNQEIKLKSEVQTRKEYRMDEDNRSSALDMIDEEAGNSATKMKETLASPEQPKDKEQKQSGGAAAFHLENLSKNEYKVMRAFLLSSQLSVVVKSHELKCMVIKKQDKVYFHESIKKIFDERMSAYDFKDIDRPMKEVIQVERMRQNGRKWELFKRQFEQQVLKQSYQERKRLYGKPS